MSRDGTALSDLRVVLGGSGFRRLLAVRLAGQGSDGLFQVALASLFFFSPERQSTASGVAAAFTVLLLPFTLVGPWAGVLLDRWDRRQVLVVGNLLRVGAVLLTAALLLQAGPGLALYAVVLLCLSVNRFLLAGLSASLPHVVPTDRLVTANAVSPTAGSAAAFAGAAVGFGLRPLVGEGDPGDARLLVGAAATCLLAALLALRLPRGGLGPDEPAVAGTGSRLRAVWDDLAAGLRHVRDRRTPGLALAAVGAHRLAYATVFIATILLSRNLLAEPGDTDRALTVLGLAIGATGIGFVAAALVTPVVTRRIGPSRWIVVCLALASVTAAGVAVDVSVPVAVGSGFLLGVAAQGLKIGVDTIVQRDVDDGFRGRVFVLYDAVYNAAFVGAAAAAVLVVPDDGWSPWLFTGVAAWYAVAALAYRSGVRRTTRAAPATT
ncbi:MAG: MFS transporter [Actinomycetes bacterium]